MDGQHLSFSLEQIRLQIPLLVGYPVFIKDTTVGTGVISVDTHNSSVVGIGSTFLDNIYKVHAITSTGENGEITCNIQNGQTTGVGAGLTGNFNNSNPGIATHLGRISWGRLYNLSRNENLFQLVSLDLLLTLD